MSAHDERRPPPQLTTSSSKDTATRVALALVVLGGVAGGVFGARWVRDYGKVAQDAERVVHTALASTRAQNAAARAAEAERAAAAGLPPQRPGQPVWADEDEEEAAAAAGAGEQPKAAAPRPAAPLHPVPPPVLAQPGAPRSERKAMAGVGLAYGGATPPPGGSEGGTEEAAAHGHEGGAGGSRSGGGPGAEAPAAGAQGREMR